MSIVMEANFCEDRYDVSSQETLRRELADNASQIHYYEEHLEKAKLLPQATRADIDHLKEMIDDLYEEREKLSSKYMKALRDNK